METLEKKSIKNKINTLNYDINYNNDVELLVKISESTNWKFYDFETSYNNWLKKLKF